MRYRVLHPPYRYRRTGLILVVLALYTVVLLVVPSFVGSTLTHPVREVRVLAGLSSSGVDDPLTHPAANVSAELMLRTARTDRVVALTFDDGPDPEHTPQVLALLAQYDAVATFCMVGSVAARYPDLVRQVVAAGMRLCDHTVSHDGHLVNRPVSQIAAEIVGGRADLLTAAGPGVTVDYFRAPAGRWSEPMRQIAARNGMTSLSWSVDTRDWTRPGAAQIVATVQQQVQPGAVILLHDAGGPRDHTVAALAELLPWLVEEGYQFDVPGR